MKNRKQALAKSLLALLLCVAMLVSTTFAWFTDSVVSGYNTIAAGNLGVELYHSNATVSDEKVTVSTQLFLDQQGNPILWEPGVVTYENLRVVNEGDLALIYQLALNTANENYLIDGANQYRLSQVLKVGVVKGGITATDRAGVISSVAAADWTTLSNFLRQGSLLADGQETWGIVIYWQPGDNDNNWNANNGKQLSSGTALSIDLGIKLTATQEMSENDSFGNDYDISAKDDVFPSFGGGTASAPVAVANGYTTEAVTIAIGDITATVPAGVKVAEGTTALTLTIKNLPSSSANIVLGEDEALRSLDVHIDGVAEDNTTPITVTLPEVAPVALNMGNYNVYHVEKGATNEMTLVAADVAFDAHNQYKYDPANGDVVLYMATFSEVAVVAETEKAWEGKFDYTWYDASKTELTIANADQLAGLSAIVGGMNGQTRDSFADKTIKLIADINLGDKESENNPNLIFYPIGYNSDDGKYEKTGVAINSSLKTFEGTFDGNGHTIANFYHNTWEMKGDHNWYSPEEQYYRDGMGLFGRVYKGTVKNLTVKNFSADGEIATTGVIAAYADGATFENIAVFNCNPRVYNIGNGGIVGCVGWYAKEVNLKTTFKNITVDNSNKISALWGSYDVACGGIVGQYYPTSGQSSAEYPVNAGVHFENCHVSAIMDVYNDVCANYQYYAYRYTGMLIGSVRENETIDGHSYPKMDRITAKDCTVHFGTWNDYYYCEIIDNTTASYTHDYQMSRLTEIKAIDGTTITYLDGTTGTVPASGRANYVIVDYTKGHGTENATCYHFKDGAVWNHEMGGIQTGIDENGDGKDDLKEDKQHIYLEFNNLVTGYGWGVTSKGVGDLAGVTILDREVGNSVVKFKGKVTEIANYKEYKLGDIFTLVDNGVKLVPGALAVSVTNLDEKNPVSATIVYDRENWENGTITLTGTGKVNITIQDYYFCTPTTITVNIIARENEEKFETKFTGDFLYRVGNKNAVSIGSLFKAKDGVKIGTVSVTIDAVDGTAASGTYTSNATWTNGTIKFSGTGVVKVTITDNDYCKDTVLFLEVVDAVNATGATNATANNVVLLNDAGFGSLEVSGGYALYGNGFTLTCAVDSVAIDRTYSFVELNNGTLDNVQIVVPNFSHSILYDKNKTEGGNPSNTDSNGRTRYYNIRSAVVMTGNSKIANSFVSGGRAAVYCISGNPVIENSTIKGGAAANIHVEQNNHLTLKDITLIQKPIKATVNDTSKTVMGFSVIAVCDTSGNGAHITLEGTLRQYAWAHKGYSSYVPDGGEDVIEQALSKTDYLHNITYPDGTTASSVNLGFVYMPDGLTSKAISSLTDNRTDKAEVPYGETSLSSERVKVYTYKKTNGTHSSVQTEPSYTPNKQNSVRPSVTYSDTNANRVFSTAYDDAKGWTSTLKVDVDAGVYTFSFDKLLAQKYGKNLNYTIKDTDGNTVDKKAAIELNSSVTNEYTLEITDNLIYDKDGNQTGSSATHTHTFVLLSTKTSLPAPTWTSTTLNGTPYIVVDSKGGDWNCAVPVLDGLKVQYWSKKQSKEIELDLANVVSAAGLSKGLQNGSNNTITIPVADEYTLTITTTGFKTNDNGKPVVVNGKLYFTVASSSNYVSTGTTSRTPNIKYVFTDANNSDPISLDTSFQVVYKTYSGTQYVYSDFCKGNLAEASCVTPDTLITLADGSQVRVDSLKGDEMLLVWNLETGKYEAAPIVFVDSESEMEYEIIHLYFSDGSDVKVISEHGFFDLDLGKYVYIDATNYADYIGHRFVAEGDIATNEWNVITLDDVIIEREVTTAWSPVTFEHLCYYTNGVLSMPGGISGLFNIFEVDTETMTYDAEQMQKDIETYGLLTLEDFGGLITQDAFDAFNGEWLLVAMGKGLITWDDIAYLAERYIPLM